jgi:glycosyltransferase involved in cell wall biosynthesis
LPAKERNILIIVQNLPVPFDRRVWQEATSLRRAGFGVAVICPKSKVYTASYERQEDVDIYRYPLIYEGDVGAAGYLVEFVYCWLVTLGLAIKAYAHRPFQAIHACNPPDTYFALALLFRALGVKFVFDHHDLCPELYIAKGRSRSGLLYRALLFLERLTLRSADAVIAVNQSHCDIALRRGGIDSSKVAIVRSGPPCAWADVNEARPELKQGRRYLVIFLGVMGKQDGVDLLLRVIAEYRITYGDDTLFALIGGGSERQRMIDMAQRMGLAEATHFTGRISNQELWTYLSTADLCVDPVPFSEWSNMSTMNKIIEYMAFGRPIVAFDLLEHRRSAEAAAVYVQPNDDAGLARAIRELLLDVERRHRMSQFARDRFRKVLAWENSEKQLITTYKQLLDDNACAQVAQHPVPHDY